MTLSVPAENTSGKIIWLGNFKLERVTNALPERPTQIPTPNAPAATPLKTSATLGDTGKVATAGLQLSPRWKNIAKGDPCATELNNLLPDKTEAKTDLGAHPEIMLWKGISYLMPLAKASPLVSKKIAPTVIPILCSAFPHESFFYSVYDGQFSYAIKITVPGVPPYDDHETYDQMVLVTDNAKQVVALELVFTGLTDHTSFLTASPDYKIADFIQSVTKSLNTWSVFHFETESKDGLILIYSELMTNQGKVKRRTLLFLPQPIANLVRYDVEKLQH